MDDALPRVSVVIPTYDRRDRLHRVLGSLARQDLPEPFEIVVVSDGSTDGTDEYLASGDTPVDVVVHRQDNAGPAAARNAGLALARGELIVFIDDDVVAEPGLLRAHVEAHGRGGDDLVVIGPMLNPDDHVMSPWIAWEQSMLAKQYDAMDAGWYTATMRQFYTGNASVRADHVRAVGGFDTAFTRAEDVELAYRLHDRGLDFQYEPTAVGRHYAERAYTSWRATAVAYGRNDVVFARDLGRTMVYEFVRQGFDEHHRAIRALVVATLGRRRTHRVVMRLLEALLSVVVRVGAPTRRLLSVIYALAYHEAIATELGGREAAMRLLVGEPNR